MSRQWEPLKVGNPERPSLGIRPFESPAIAVQEPALAAAVALVDQRLARKPVAVSLGLGCSPHSVYKKAELLQIWGMLQPVVLLLALGALAGHENCTPFPAAVSR